MASAIRRTASMRRSTVHRENLQPEECLCSYCPAKCCRYYALPIETPECWRDFDFMRWFLLHDGATVFTEDDTWYLLQYSKCKHLGNDHLCRIYTTRPDICRQYNTLDCEYEDTWVYDRYLETSEQVQEYAEAVLGPKRGRSIRSPKPK